MKMNIRTFYEMMVIGLIVFMFAGGAFAANKSTKKNVKTKKTVQMTSQMKLAPVVDIGVAMVDTISCLCTSDLGRIGVMAPSKVRVKVFNNSSKTVPVMLKLEFKVYGKRDEFLTRFFSLGPNEVKWVNFWQNPGMIFYKSKGLKATIKCLAAKNKMKELNLSNNSYTNDTCYGYVE